MPVQEHRASWAIALCPQLGNGDNKHSVGRPSAEGRLANKDRKERGARVACNGVSRDFVAQPKDVTLCCGHLLLAQLHLESAPPSVRKLNDDVNFEAVRVSVVAHFSVGDRPEREVRLARPATPFVARLVERERRRCQLPEERLGECPMSGVGSVRPDLEQG